MGAKKTGTNDNTPKNETDGKAGVFVAQVVPARSRRRRQFKFVLIGLGALLLCGGIFWLASTLGDDSANRPGQTAKPVDQVAEMRAAAVRQAYAKGDYRAAAEELESTAPSDYANRRKLAYTYENAKEHTKALAVYEELERAGQLKAAYTLRAAEAAKAAGNKETAVRFYKLAKERYKKEGGPRADTKIKRIDEALKGLGAQ